MVFVFKFVLAGDSKAGKSSLIKRYVDGSFGIASPQINAVKQFVKPVAIKGETAKLQILEVPNQENAFKPNNCYRGAHAILLLFSLFDNDSCQSIPIWLEEISRYCSGNVKVILVGTKADRLFSHRANLSDQNYSIYNGKNTYTTSKIDNNLPTNNTNYENTNNKNASNKIEYNLPANSAEHINNITTNNAINKVENSITINHNNGNTTIASLPVELLDHIFKHLDLRSLLFSCFVNWEWYRILNSQDTWMRLYKQDFKGSSHYHTDWKTAYIQKYITTRSAIHKARQFANQYGLPLVLTSARTGLNVHELFSEVAHLLFDKVKQMDHQDEIQLPLWRGRACSVLLKEKGNLHSNNALFKNFFTPHRIQISDSKLFIRGIETTSVKCILPGRDIVSVYIEEHDKKPNVALKLHTRQGNNYTFLFESQARAEAWRMYITNM